MSASFDSEPQRIHKEEPLRLGSLGTKNFPLELGQIVLTLHWKNGRQIDANAVSALRKFSALHNGLTKEIRLNRTWANLAKILEGHDDSVRLYILESVSIFLTHYGSLPKAVVKWLEFKPESNVTDQKREIRKFLQSLKEHWAQTLPPTRASGGAEDEPLKIRSERILESGRVFDVYSGKITPTKSLIAWELLRSPSGAHRIHDLPVRKDHHDRRTVIKDLTVRNFRRIQTYAHTFWRLSGETATTSEPLSMLGSFLKEVSSDWALLHSSDPNVSPGRGFWFKGLKPSEIYPGVSKEKLESTFTHYKDVLKLLPEIEITIVRGGYLVYHPDLRLSNDGCGSRNFLLFIANDHLAGSYDLAFLVPAERCLADIHNARYDWKVGVTESTGDLRWSHISTTRYEHDKHPDHPVCNLSSCSGIFGGPVAGFPFGSTPLLEIEKDILQYGSRTTSTAAGMGSAWQDGRNRYHYAAFLNYHKMYHANPGVSEESRQHKVDNFLLPYENATLELLNIVNSLLGALDVTFHCYASWKINGDRIKKELYLEREKILRDRIDPDQARVLVLLDRFDKSKLPELVVDPKDMVLRQNGKQIGLLPSHLEQWDKDSDIDWGRGLTARVRTKTTETNLEPAFIRRSYL